MEIKAVNILNVLSQIDVPEGYCVPEDDRSFLFETFSDLACVLCLGQVLICTFCNNNTNNHKYNFKKTESMNCKMFVVKVILKTKTSTMNATLPTP